MYTKPDGSIDVDKLPATWTSGGVTYTKDELQATLAKIGSSVTREDYLKAQRHNWRAFFIPPAIFALFWALLFVVFGKQPVDAAAVPDKKPAETPAVSA